MKTILNITLTLTFIAMVSATNCSAADNNKSKSLHRQIEKCLYYPGQAGDNIENAVVYVSFSVSENNKIIIHELNGTNKLFSDFVSKKLTSLDLKNVSTEAGREYVYKMSFRKE